MYLHRLVHIVMIAAVLLLGPAWPAAPPEEVSGYVEPSLRAGAGQELAVIVEATDSDAAARAVEYVGGRVTSELWIIDSVAAHVPAGALDALAAQPGVRAVTANKGVHSSAWDGWVTKYPLPDHWDGRLDVQPTSDPRVWQLVNPVTIDIGADVLHQTTLPGGAPIRGTGVTVALVDSGVYFDDTVRQQLGEVVQKQFVGQADFVDSTCPTRTLRNGQARRVGQQESEHCWLTHRDTADGYGHGTGVASIIWNNFRDATTGVTIGVAPEASILSVRVLDNSGVGSYETVIRGIQYVVQHRSRFNVRVLNLSLSALATTPYFVDPLNRAVERAWSRGIAVLVAAGNDGPAAESISVPGNDPYVITVGAVDENRTPGYWTDDFVPTWSAVGPTADGFVKPDILAPGANIVTFMHNSQKIVQVHPDYSATTSLFRMNGTSMSTAIGSGVVALMLQANPQLTPDQVKYRLAATARPALSGEPPELVYSPFQQGLGRIWVPDAVLGPFAAEGNGNPGMNINSDLRHGWRSDGDLAFHYQGPVRKMLSDDGLAYLYYVLDEDGVEVALAAAWADNRFLLDRDTLASGRMAWAGGRMAWAGGRMAWAGGLSLASGRMAWAGGRMAWAGGRMAWAGGRMAWAGGRMAWAGSLNWSPGPDLATSGRMAWAGTLDARSAAVAATRWIDDH